MKIPRKWKKTICVIFAFVLMLIIVKRDTSDQYIADAQNKTMVASNDMKNGD